MLQYRDDSPEAVKLIDFGIAKVDKSASNPRITTVIVAGTVRYMAPEQFEGENSPASDVIRWARGCELISGHPDVRALPKSTSGATKAALESALAFRPADRPSDVERWSERLADSLVEGPRRTRWMVASAAAAVLSDYQ